MFVRTLVYNVFELSFDTLTGSCDFVSLNTCFNEGFIVVTFRTALELLKERTVCVGIISVFGNVH